MAPYLELTTVVINDAYSTEQTKLALEITNRQDGIIKIFSGLAHEDPKTWYLFNAWETMNNIDKLRYDTSELAALREATRTFSTSITDVVYIPARSDSYDAFSAPITEVVIASAKPGKDRAVVEKAVESLANIVNTPPGVKAHAATWGPLVEHSDKVALIIGWESVERHRSVVADNPEVNKLVANLREVADLAVKHVALSEFRKE